MDGDTFRERREEAKSIPDERGQWFQLVYNEQHASADEWFAERGWTATATALADYLQSLGRRLPGPDSQAFDMINSVRLVSAVKS